MSAPADDVGRIIEAALARVNTTSFGESLDEQHQAIQVVQSLYKGGGDLALSAGEGQRLAEAIARGLGEPLERVLQIAKLATPIEVRRALKARSLPRPARRADEAIYPTDGWLGTYLDFTLLTEQPLGWHFWCGVTVLAAAARRNLYMDLGFEDVLFPNHYVFLVGGTGLGKNQAINRATNVLARANRSMRLLRGCAQRATDLRIAVMNEATAEGLVDYMAPGPVYLDPIKQMVERHESVGIIINSEAKSILGKDRRELAERLFTYLTDLYDGKPRVAVTRGSGEKTLAPAALSLILGSNLEWIITGISRSLIGGGFTGRCTFVHREERHRIKYRDIPRDYVPDPAVEEALADQLVQWMLAPSLECVFTKAAQEWWEDWYVRHKETPVPDASLVGWWERKPIHVASLAMVLLMSDLSGPNLLDQLEGRHSLPMAPSYLQKALALLEVEQGLIPKLLEQIDRAPEVDLTGYVFGRIQQMEAEAGGPVLHSTLSNSVHWKVGTAARLNTILETLEDRGLIDRVRQGRSSLYSTIPPKA